jgi:hypothetical protein
VLGRVGDAVDTGRTRIELVEVGALEIDGCLPLGQDSLGVDGRLAVGTDGEEAEGDMPECLVLLLGDITGGEEAILA